MEDVVAELLGDAEEDEVAFRAGRRLVSVLQHTDAATRPITIDTNIDDETIFRIRPAHGEDEEAMGDKKNEEASPARAPGNARGNRSQEVLRGNNKVPSLFDEQNAVAEQTK